LDAMVAIEGRTSLFLFGWPGSIPVLEVIFTDPDGQVTPIDEGLIIFSPIANLIFYNFLILATFVLNLIYKDNVFPHCHMDIAIYIRISYSAKYFLLFPPT